MGSVDWWAFTFGTLLGALLGLGVSIYFYTREQYMEYGWKKTPAGERLYAGKVAIGSYCKLPYDHDEGKYRFDFELPGFRPFHDDDVEYLKVRAVQLSDDFFNRAFEEVASARDRNYKRSIGYVRRVRD